MTTYITSDSDTVDYIAFKYYGTLSGRTAEKVLEANPGLAEYGPQLPAGVSIAMPVIDTATKTSGVKLWT
jgi:phage tail protein X